MEIAFGLFAEFVILLLWIITDKLSLIARLLGAKGD